MKQFAVRWIVLFFVLLPAFSAFGDRYQNDKVFDSLIHVPGDFPTIQSGINAASDGDTVLVAAGVYTGNENRNIDFCGKAITVISEKGAAETIIDCQEEARGVIFQSGEGSESKLIGFTIQNGYVDNDGGGIYCVDSSPEFSDCIVKWNTIINNDDGCGGGFYFYNSSSTISNCTISNNYVDCLNVSWGSGFYCENSVLSLSGCTISGNTMFGGISGYGGGARCSDSNLIISNCVFSINTALGDHSGAGGGLSLGNCTIILDDSHIFRNSFRTYSGGPVGGGISQGGGSLSIVNCSITGNGCSGPGNSHGGGIRSRGILMIENSIFSNNSVTSEVFSSYGGGISCANATISNSMIFGNKSEGGTYSSAYGGGVDGSPLMRNCLIFDNTATSSHYAGCPGGGVYGPATLINCTITRNSSYAGGADIANIEEITNCIVWNDDISGSPNVTYSDIEGGWPGEGNIDSDPMFFNPGSDDFHLTVSSPCIDVGSDAGIYDDIDGDTRPQGEWFDIGSDEFSLERPVIRIRPDSFFVTCLIGGHAEDAELVISNAGVEDLTYSIDPETEFWLALVGELEGVLAHNDSVLILLQFDSGELLPGRYDDVIRIDSNDTQVPQLDIQVDLWVCQGIIRVPEDYETIQAGIDAADSGDTVLVAAGTYTGSGNINLTFNGKPITLMSEDGLEKTAIDCAEAGRGVSFNNDEGPASRFVGFTIINGYQPGAGGGGIRCIHTDPTITSCLLSGNDAEYGGGIYCWGSSPSITGCSISGNSAEYGAGIKCIGADPLITHCLISENSANSGAAIYCEHSSPIITNCLIKGNIAEWHGACYMRDSDEPVFINCTFTENSGGGFYCYEWSHPKLKNCILWNDTPFEISLGYEGSITVDYSDVQGGWTGVGNIDTDPLFSIYANFDYILRTASPCIDSGDPYIEDCLYDWHPLCPAWYLNGSRSDMGAYGGPGNIFWLKWW